MDRRLPGGYGNFTGENAQISRSQSQFIRASLIPDEGAWVISPLGENLYAHLDVTGVQLGQDVLKLYWLPTLSRALLPYEARLNVALAVANSYIETALYTYDARNSLAQIPGTYSRFDSTSTGLKQTILPNSRLLSSKMAIFLGVAAHGGNPTLQGMQSGTVTTPRLIRARTITSHSEKLHPIYRFQELSYDVSGDVPMVAYLSKEAASVL